MCIRDRIKDLKRAGVEEEAIALDPGIGFGKTQEHNLQLLAHLERYRRFGRPVCLGVSRKGVIGVLCGRDRSERMPGSLAVACFAVARNPGLILRVHDVAPHRDAAVLYEAIAAHRKASEDDIPF